MFCGKEGMKEIIRIRGDVIKNIVCFDEIEEEEWIEEAKKDGVRFWTINEVMQVGEKNIKLYKDVQPNDVFCFSYTSGTTGE